MNNQRVAHEWWKGTKRQSKGSNMFFEGETIYSYGYHFPMAQIVRTSDSNMPYVLMTSARYSVSTSKHLNYTLSAIDRHACAALINVDLTLGRINFEYPSGYSARIAEMLSSRLDVAIRHIESAAKPRIRANTRLSCLSNLAFECGNIRSLLAMAAALGTPLPEPADLAQWDGLAESERVRLEPIAAAYNERKRQAEETRRAERERIYYADQAERLADWRAGSPGFIGRMSDGYALRIRGAHVETSGGVQIPISLAKRLLPLAHRSFEGRADTAAFKAEGVNEIGGYPVHSISSDSWTIGCHLIPASELRRIAEELKGV